MIESFYGPNYLSVGILIDQLGTYLVLGTLGILVACIYSENRASPREIAMRIVTFPPLIAMLVALAVIPLVFPDWLTTTLHRLGSTLAPLALISVGLQLRLAAFSNNKMALAAGLGFKLILGPALLAVIYVAVMQNDSEHRARHAL